MKFVHLADVHLDMPFTSLKSNKELAKRRRLEQKFVFKKAIDLVKEEKAQALFIAGDLFEDKFVEDDTISYVISCLKEISDVKVYITPGNHDPLIKSSPYNTFEWPDNVFVFGSEVGMDSFDNVNIYGIGFDDFEMDSMAIKDIELVNDEDNKDKINILITHATLDGASHKYHDVKTSWLEKFDYVALGHIHMPCLNCLKQSPESNKIAYSGSLIAGGFDETGEHGLVVGEITKGVEEENKTGQLKIDPEEKVNLKIKFVKMDDTEFEVKEIDITECKSSTEVLDKLNLKDNIYKVILTGIRNIDVESVKEILQLSGKYVCEIEDKTRMDYDLNGIAKQKTLKGIFTKKMLEEIKYNPQDEDKVMKAIEYVYNNM